MALVEGKPIINPDWLKAVLECSPGSTLPDVESYQPPKSKGLIINDTDMFKVNTQRKTLFKDLTFVFLTDDQVNVCANNCFYGLV
jgi:hypothetical protein